MPTFNRRGWLVQAASLAAWARLGSGAELATLVCASRTLERPAGLRAPAVPQVIYALRIHPGGQWIYTGGDQHVIDVWDSVAGTHVATLTHHTDAVRALALSPSGDWLVSAGADGRVVLWDTATREVCAELLTTSEACTAVEWHPQEPAIAVATFGGRVHTIDIATRRERPVLEKLGDDLRALAYSPDGKLLAVGGRSGRVQIIQLHDRQVEATTAAHAARVRTTIFSGDSAGFLSAGDDGLVKFTPLSAGQAGFHLPPQAGRILALAICRDNQIATAGSDNRIRLWDGRTRTLLGEVGAHSGSVTALDCLGDTLVSGGFDTEVKVWHLPPRPGQQPLEPRVSSRSLFRLE